MPGQADQNIADDKAPDITATLASITEQLKNQGAALQGVMAKLEDVTTAKPEPVADPDDIQFDDKSEINSVVEKLSPAIARTAAATAARVVNESIDQDRVLNQLKAEYPELKDPAHEMTKTALGIFKSLPKGEQTARGMEYAAIKAAKKLNITSADQRSKADEGEDFVVGGGNPPAKPRKKGDKDLNETETAWSEELGLDPEKVAARAANRPQWGRYTNNQNEPAKRGSK